VTRPRRRGLFRRIWGTFLSTLLGFVGVVALTAFVLGDLWAPAWIERALERTPAARDQLANVAEDPERLAQRARELEEELGLAIRVWDRRRRERDRGRDGGRGEEWERGFGPPPDRLGPEGRSRRRVRELLRGQPVVAAGDHRSPPAIYFGLPDPSGERLLVVLAFEPSARDQLRRLGAIALVAGLVVAAAVGSWLLARALASRLRTLERGADRIAGGDLGHRMEVPVGRDPDEIDAVAMAFNAMAERVQGSLAAQRRLLANASHELRTPLARMQVLLEILQERAQGPHGEARIREGLADLRRDADEMEALVADLLTGGRLDLAQDGGAALPRERVAVLALCTAAAQRFSAQVGGDASAAVLGEPLLLGRLVSNLLANARRACPDGAIRVECRVEAGWVEIVVDDEGPGIPASEREAIFAPFVRLDASRARDAGGTGLGLYLCRQIATAHGGTVVATDRRDGRPGASLRVRLPSC
jgi:signal transduction histidine kinase